MYGDRKPPLACTAVNFMSTAPRRKAGLCDKKRTLKGVLFCSFGVAILLLISGRSRLGSSWSQGPFETDTLERGNSTLYGTIYNGSRYGYIFVSHYSDQMTGGSFNILSLQCWAAAVSTRVRVVKPFLRGGSKFGFAFSSSKHTASENETEKNLIELGDLFDMDSWKAQTDKLGYAPLADWDDLFSFAPRSLITVTKKCSDKEQCDDKFYQSVSAFARKYSFTVVHSAHLELKRYTMQEFTSVVYGQNRPGDVVVVFNYWGGLVRAPRANRVAISDVKSCNRNLFSDFLFRNSKRIEEDSQRYVRQYLTGNRAEDRGYISVMFRSERFALAHDFHSIKSEEEKLSMLSSCIKNIGKSVDKLKTLYGIDSVFLAMDCTEQGSSGFRNLGNTHSYLTAELANTVATLLHHTLYGNHSTVKDWEESFNKVSSFKTAGYLAQVQKNLAARGTCLLTAGGGTFQLSAEKLYNVMHNQSNSVRCAIRVPKCW